MGKISNNTKYPIKPTPVLADYLIGTDSETAAKQTVSFSFDKIKELLASHTVLSGTSVPDAAVGDPGDFYIRVTVGGSITLYGPKDSVTNWVGTDISMIGPAGTDGFTILNGTVAPTTEGAAGDFYIDTAAWNIYGPKEGSWGEATSIVGAPGTPGADGLTILNGTIPPTSEGVDGDFYIDTALSVIYGPKAAGSWPAGIELKGTDGADGDDGAPGTPGAKIFYLEDPSAVEGDLWLDDSDYSNIYFKQLVSSTWSIIATIPQIKAADRDPVIGYVPGEGTATDPGAVNSVFINSISGDIFRRQQHPTSAWILIGNLAGTDGEDGAPGADGDDGASGADGKTILTGGVDPLPEEGEIGDFFIRQDALTYIFGPKTLSGWGTGIRLTGADGSAGAAGTDGRTILNGTVSPTTEGEIGDFYLNTISSFLSGPKTAGGWLTGVSLVGAPGASGNTILNGTVDPTWQGAYGDFYFNTLTSTLFGPKDSGVWPAGVSLVGAAGSSGTDGTDGTDGISAYTYVAYASSDAGADFSNVFSQDLNYIAVLATDTEIATPTASDFTGLWKYYGGGSLNTPEGLFTCDLDESYALDLGYAETEVVIPLTEQIADNLALEYDHIVIDSSIDKFYRCHIDINGSMIPNQACNLLLNLYVDAVLIRSRVLTIIEPAEGVFIPDLMVMDYTLEGITGGSSIHMTVEALESGVVVAPQEFNVRCTFVEYIPEESEGGFVDEEGFTMVDEEDDVMIDETE